MKVLLYLLLLAVISGTQACWSEPEPEPSLEYDPDCQCGKLQTLTPGYVHVDVRRRRREAGENDDTAATGNGTRIVGGVNAGLYEFPWIIRLRRKVFEANGQDTNEEELCGGTLLSTKTVLTAAHCINEDSDPSRYTVFVGDWNQDVEDDFETEHAVESVDPHGNFNYGKKDYDYGIIQLKDEVVFSHYVYPICWPENGNYDKSDVVTIGWGLTAPEGQVSAILQKVSLKSVDRRTCSISIFRRGRKMCYGKITTDPNKEESTCNGDSGGPAMVEIKDSNNNPYYYVQTGITSYTDDTVPNTQKGCTWSVFARVSNQLNWIKRRIKGKACRPPPSQ